jgi:hypothetical protein
VNHHTGHTTGKGEAYCGSGGYPPGLRMPTVCTTHEAFHRMFDSTPDYSLPYVASREPAIGAVGQSVFAKAYFNGWGYVHLFSAQPASGKKLVELDTYSVPEAMNPAFAKGFGDLSVHEVATSLQRNNLAYYSYYSAGMRVTKIVDGKLVEVGHYLDPRGSDFWGVEAFIGKDGKEYFVGSDRNFGLQIFRYTGR